MVITTIGQRPTPTVLQNVGGQEDRHRLPTKNWIAKVSTILMAAVALGSSTVLTHSLIQALAKESPSPEARHPGLRGATPLALSDIKPIDVSASRRLALQLNNNTETTAYTPQIRETLSKSQEKDVSDFFIGLFIFVGTSVSCVYFILTFCGERLAEDNKDISARGVCSGG